MRRLLRCHSDCRRAREGAKGSEEIGPRGGWGFIREGEFCVLEKKRKIGTGRREGEQREETGNNPAHTNTQTAGTATATVHAAGSWPLLVQ
jgi:hypothetical protein